jgi:RNA polymerase sigma-70 factor (family 1)
MNALETLFKDNFIKLCEFALKWTRSEELAKDVVQEAFVVFIEKPLLLQKPLPAVKNLLYTMVRNKSIDAYRRSKAQVRNTAQDAEVDDGDSDHLDNLIKAEIVGELQKEINNLPLACRAICELIYFHDKKYKDVAQELNISINTVKTQRQRAIKALRNKFLNAFIALFT